MFLMNKPKKKTGKKNLIIDKIGFKLKLKRRDREGHNTLIKGKIYQEDSAILNTYAPNHGHPS